MLCDSCLQFITCFFCIGSDKDHDAKQIKPITAERHDILFDIHLSFVFLFRIGTRNTLVPTTLKPSAIASDLTTVIRTVAQLRHVKIQQKSL